MYRRAVVIYIGAIVLPAIVLLWLGIESFERQRQALATLTAEKVATTTEARLREAAKAALSGASHPIAEFRFTVQAGEVVRPALQSPPPLPSPPEFAVAERVELTDHRPDVALEIYRKLAVSHPRRGLALSRVARCLAKLDRADEARATWREVAARHADERDLAHRPLGIVAALQSGDTAGLLERIQAGRWDLPADQAEFFTAQLGGRLHASYAFGRELRDGFRPQRVVRHGEMYPYALGSRRLFYTSDNDNLIRGVSVNGTWVDETLRPQVRRDVEVSGPDGLRLYGGAIALVITILGAGVFLLVRDVSREANFNRIRSDFVGSVSHELKTPITLIRLYAETLLGPANFGEEERRGFCRIIVRESDRLARLVEGVLTFSRIERGERVYSFEDGDAVPIIARTVEEYSDYLERAGFRLERTIPESGPRVRFDSTAISQAVRNLLDNAVKYSGESREVAVRLHAARASLIVEVEDRGIGIAEAERGRIFDRYYRVPNGTGKGGYGIGLFLVRHIMEAHGGRAEVESAPGQGTRFRLVLPAVSA